MRNAVVTLLLALGTPALATDYPDVASLLEAVRSGKQKLNRQVKIGKAVLTTAPVAWDHDGVKPYTTWFYVNDAGRDGDGVLISLPNYYAGTNPFDDEGVDDNPWEGEIEIPALERGRAIEISGRLERRDDDSGGFALVRYDLEGVELVPDPPEADSLSGSLKAELRLLPKVSLPAQKAPSGVAVAESALRAGEVVVVSGKDLGDRARVLLDGKRLVVSDRRPGLILAVVPSDAAPGAHELRVQNPTGRSDAVSVRVLAPEAPPVPQLESARLAGRILTVRGQALSGQGLEVRVGGQKVERVLSAGARQIVVELASGQAGNVQVVVDGRESNAVAIGAPAAGVGINGAIPGQ